jgi:F0F1-type ATP synthase membrane subunit b/b'
MGSKRDRNTQSNLRRGREELVYMRQKVAAAEGKIEEARAHAGKAIDQARREAAKSFDQMREFKKSMMGILNRLRQMELIGDQQHHEAIRWMDDLNSQHVVIRDEEESLYTMFTQQHYAAIAKVIRETRQEITEDGSHNQNIKHEAISELQANLMKMLSKDNPKFKDLLFIAAASEHGPEK